MKHIQLFENFIESADQILEAAALPAKPTTPLTDDDLMGDTTGLSSFINTVIPAAKYAAFIAAPVLGIPAALGAGAALAVGAAGAGAAVSTGVATGLLGATIEQLKDRRTGVKGAIDALDGFVKESDLLYVLTILKALVGRKAADGTSAIERFKKLYKLDDGEELIDDVKSVGTKTMSVKGPFIKEELIKILSNKAA
jgi:hypothetical protein